MRTRSTVLGKRGHQDSSSVSNSLCDQLQTPDNTPNPKRARTATVVIDGNSNKENIPPFNISPIHIAATPTSNLMELTLSTPPPSPPASLLPIQARVRALLRSTCNNTSSSIAGRDLERTSLLQFLTSFIDGKSIDHDTHTTSMFISGAPGTGKTALVNATICDLLAKNDHVKVISVNCMALKSVDALWERIIEDLATTPRRKSTTSKKTNSHDRLKALLSTLNSQCILILDELDHVTPNSQSLASIFSLPHAIPSVLRLIGIANTHTLTTSSNSATLTPSKNVQTIHFAPYTPTQLQNILQSRLSPLHSTELAIEVNKFLPPPTLTLLTKKVAALTGDVRSLFEVLRGAIDLAVAPSTTRNSVDENPFNAPKATVTPQHILAALKAYTPAAAKTPTTNSIANTSPTTSNSETVTKIRNLGLQAQLVLLVILLGSKRLEVGLSLSTSCNSSPKKSPKKGTATALKRTASSPNPALGAAVGIETGLLHTYYTTVLSRSDLGIFTPVSRSEFADLMGVLEGVGLVSLSSSLFASESGTSPGKGRKAFGRSASFGSGLGKNSAGAVGVVRLVESLWADEILRGLGTSGADVSPASDDMPVDARKEEICGIWEREKSRLTKDLKSLASATSTASRSETFAGAFQD